MERRLAAILVADVVGFSRLMQSDEEGTLERLQSLKAQVIAPAMAKHFGRIVKDMGDGFLAEFPSVVEAVECSVEVQRTIASRNRAAKGPARIAYRMGVNLGDVMVTGNDIYGDGVNIASRLEKIASSGGITISGAVQAHIARRLDLPFEDLGKKKFKNIAEPVQVYGLAVCRDEGVSVPVRTPPAYPAIAVLPMENLSNDPAQEYFCDGLTQDITTELCRFPTLSVVTSKTAFVYKGARRSAEQIGNDLDCRYLLEGTVQKVANTVRINTQLIDAQSGVHLWAHRFDSRLTDIFEIQEQIIHRVVAALAPKVAAAERARAMKRQTGSASAYDLFLRGVHHFATNIERVSETEGAIAESRRWFEKAIELDPDYARAWGWLAYSYVTGWTEGWSGPEVLDLAKDYAEKAVALDPEDYDTHWALAAVYSARKEMRAALGEYTAALALNQNDPDMLVDMAETLCCMGHAEQARRQIEHAMAINPRFPEWYRWMLGWVLYHLHKYRLSNEQLDRIVNPNNEVRLIRAANFANLGERAKAAAVMREFLRKRPDWTLEQERKTLSYRNSRDEAHWLDGLRKAGLPER